MKCRRSAEHDVQIPHLRLGLSQRFQMTSQTVSRTSKSLITDTSLSNIPLLPTQLKKELLFSGHIQMIDIESVDCITIFSLINTIFSKKIDRKSEYKQQGLVYPSLSSVALSSVDVECGWMDGLCSICV